MLSQLTIEYEDGRTEVKIVPINESTIYPQRDRIKHAFHKPFKYEVEKHPLLPKAIIRLGGKFYIYPAQIECHPQTTLDDIIEIIPESQQQKEEITLQVKKEEPKTWSFESSSGGGTYTVKQTKTGKLICDCPGVWRSKDRKCKHIKEVETY